MKTLHYHLICSDLDLINGTNISAAGTPGFQQWTPLLDVEHLLYGKVISETPPEVSINLSTGSISPMAPVRAMLLKMRESATVIVHIYALGMRHNPKVDADLTPFPVEYVQLNLPLRGIQDPDAGMLPEHFEILQDAVFNIYHTLHENDTAHEHHIIAECVPGGTTTANVMLNLVRDAYITTPSSSTDPVTAAAKARLVRQLTDEASKDFTQKIRASKDFPHLMAMRRISYADYFQLALIGIVRGFVRDKREEPRRNPVILGGGCQMIAPIAHILKGMGPGSFLTKLLAKQVIIATTGWIVSSESFKKSGISHKDFIGQIPLKGNFNFSLQQSKHQGYRMYEQGYTKEGCGLGAVLWFMGYHMGFSDAELLRIIDDNYTKDSQ